MPDYKTLYATLFNAITDVVSTLVTAQQKTEAMYSDSADPPIHLVDPADDE